MRKQGKSREPECSVLENRVGWARRRSHRPKIRSRDGLNAAGPLPGGVEDRLSELVPTRHALVGPVIQARPPLGYQLVDKIGSILGEGRVPALIVDKLERF